MEQQLQETVNPISFFNTELPTCTNVNSLHCYLNRVSGTEISKTITLDGNNETKSHNIFQVTGTVHIYRLYAEVTVATTLADCDSASFDLFPTGGAAIQISAASGDIGGVPVGTFIFKEGLAANPFTINNPTLGAVQEQTYEGSDVFNGFMVTQKAATDTFIRFTYTTTDAPINAQLKVWAEYRGLNTSGALAAV